MPYYKWRGVDVVGASKKGFLFARSPEHLDDLLLKRQIALLSHKHVRSFFKWPIRLSDRVALFQQLATLIDAGVLVPGALSIVANQIEHSVLQEKMHEVAQMVHAGVSLSEALWQVGAVANPIIIQLVQVGEESGKLSQSLDAICTHLASTQDFYRRLRSALLLPAITLFFFLIIAVIIFTVIMPRFIDIFSSMQSEVPPLTQSLLAISAFMRSPSMGLFLSVSALAILILWRVTRRGSGRKGLDWLLIHTPFIGPILQQRFLSYAMRAMGVLLNGGLTLSQTLIIIRDSVQNHIFKNSLSVLEGDIQSGSSLGDAMARYGNDLFGPDIIAMVEVGQESGRLPVLLYRIAQTYHMRVMQRLSWITMLLQPFVMIILGLLVALLIFAVYGPILNMSRAF